MIRHCLLSALLAFALADTARADRLVFRNGRTLDGIVESETETEVVFRAGAGTMTFARSQLAAVQRTGAEANARLREEARRQNFLHPEYVPPGAEALAAAVRSLDDRRGQAVRAMRAAAGAARREAAQRKALDVLQHQRVEASRTLRGMKPRDDVAAYNALVARVNSLNAEITVMSAELAEAAEPAADPATAVSGYHAAVQRCDGLLAERRAAAPPDDVALREFLDRVASRLAHQHAEFRTQSLPLKAGARGAMATVVVNGRRSGRFLVDTGAESVVIGRDFAAGLGLAWDRLPEVRIRLGDGRESVARRAQLDSVSVGDARADDVPAVVVEGAVGPGVDGLLGMSYLRHFIVRLDAAAGVLEITRFAPAP